MKVELSTICLRLCQLLECRLPLTKSLEALMEEESNPLQLEFLKRIYQKVLSGSMLCEALPQDHWVESPLIAAMLKSCENDARLIEGLRLVATGIEEGIIPLRSIPLSEGNSNDEKVFETEEERGYLNRLLHPPYGLILISGLPESNLTQTLNSALSYLHEEQKRIQPLGNEKFYREVLAIDEVTTEGDLTNILDLAASGHSVLSTLMASSPLHTLIRMVNMNTSTSPLSTLSLRTIIFQRRVNLVCIQCSRDIPASKPLISRLNLEASFHLKEAAGCDACRQLGHSGRTNLLDFIEPSQELLQLVREGDQNQALQELSRCTRQSALASLKALAESQKITEEEIWKSLRE